MTTETPEEPTQFDTVLTPPNGERVTQALLYRSLYDLDQALSERFTTIMDAIVSGNNVSAQLRQDFEEHRKDGHPQNEHAEIIKEEIRLDSKKAALAAGCLAALTAAFTILAKIIEAAVS